MISWKLLAVTMTLTATVACVRSHAQKVGAALPNVFVSSADMALDDVIGDYTASMKRLDAFLAPYYGVEEDLDDFGDHGSPEYFGRQRRMTEVAVERLRNIDVNALSPANRRAYRLFKEDVEIGLRGFDFPRELLEFHQKDNRLLRYMDDSSPDLTQFPFDTVAHFDAFVRRADGFPAYVDRQIALFRRGIATRIVHSCGVVDKITETYQPALEPTPERNPFWRPLAKLPSDASDADRVRLTAAFRTMIATRIVPGYRRLDRFLRDEYRPHCRKTFGIGALPHGRDWYAYEIQASTTLALGAADVHRTGLREVARIDHEMEGIRREVGFQGSLAAFLRSWADAPDHYFDSADDLLQAFERMKARVATLAPKYFSLVPRTDYTIVSASNGQATAGAYWEPTDNIPHGRFVVNTINLKAVARDRVPTLSLHETVPGHHLQRALAYEMKDELSEYQRKVYESTAFTEGWGLYAEHLGRDIGVYDTPLRRLANLNDEMLRAVRLVVDTGIHAYGWSQHRARRYMARHLANDPREIESEVSRYAVRPAQALAYKVGELKILDLRQRAETALGPAFDLREFHAIVLGSGQVSLTVLEQQVDEWIERKGKAGS